MVSFRIHRLLKTEQLQAEQNAIKCNQNRFQYNKSAKQRPKAHYWLSPLDSDAF